MDDMEGQVRELLRRRAEDVPPQLDVPPELAGRGHRRFAVNALGAVVVAAVLVAGVFAGLRTIGPEPVTQPGITGPPVVSTPTCSPSQITATPALEGAMGSREGSIDLKNASVDTCTLEGTSTLTLLDGSGAPIDSGVTFDEVDPTWVVNDTRAAGWLAGGDLGRRRARRRSVLVVQLVRRSQRVFAACAPGRWTDGGAARTRGDTALQRAGCNPR